VQQIIAAQQIVCSGLDAAAADRCEQRPVRDGGRLLPSANVQMSIFSAMLSASSSSTPRYRTVLSTLV
jgi:hypothetical protein